MFFDFWLDFGNFDIECKKAGAVAANAMIASSDSVDNSAPHVDDDNEAKQVSFELLLEWFYICFFSARSWSETGTAWNKNISIRFQSFIFLKREAEEAARAAAALNAANAGKTFKQLKCLVFVWIVVVVL